MSSKTPVTFEDLNIDDRYGQLVLVKPTGTVLPARYKQFADVLYNFEYRSDDIAVVTYPKSGTTWTAEIIWAMTHINELQRAHTEHLNDRLFMLDNDFLHDMDVDPARKMLKSKRPDAKEEDGLSLQLAALEEGRRVIWSHLPFSLQNPCVLDKCKVVYTCRHPKDNLFSRFNHFAKIFNLTVEEHLPHIAEDFMTGIAIYGSYWHHVQGAWERKGHPNMHMMFYEDMKADIMSELKKLAKFLELDLTDKQLQRVSEHTSFKQMKAHPTMAPNMSGFKSSFCHKGEVGASKGMLPPEQEARMDAWVKENAEKLGPGFKYQS